ncbi:hypothetical protein CDV36_000909 [Fusarium kuroshium]|uniref:Uncharacterized protein n=2 Tax=Fusarium solani species complex TaxID=232080 RepID=A0A3M2SPA0_9HYPO|nr:hypothetical protein CDV36_000909 [Fusarium kuroshium]RSL81078.1 hypothetical protein CEP51_006098 [Fusarium floridanum]
MPGDETKGQDEDQPSTKERLTKEIQKRVDEASTLQEKSIQLHQQADEAEDSKVAEDLRFEARETDKKAAKLMKTAERLEAGWIQGGAFGTGIGAGIASGIGVTVGTLLTGVVAIPTSGLGMLIGAGTGLVHGPWVKFTEAFSKEEVESIVQDAQKEADNIIKSEKPEKSDES